MKSFILKNTTTSDNGQFSTGNYSLDALGNLSGAIKIVSTGSQYNSKAATEKMQPTEKDIHYKRYWTNINNLKIAKIDLQNDKEKIQFIENISISAENYAPNTAGKMMVPINVYNQFSGTIKRIRNRKNPFEIPRGYLDTDEITIVLPAGFQIEFLPANFELKTKYGDYKTEIIKKDNNNLVYKRTILIKKGMYANSDYDGYRLFMEQIAKNDNAKLF